MTPILKGILLAVSGSLAASIVAKGTVVVALAFAGVWGARHSRAAARHAVMAAAFVVLALLPIASIVVPAVQIALPAVAQDEAARPSLEVAINAAPPAVAMDAAVGGAPAISRSSGFPAFALLLAVWAIGAVLCLLPMAAGLWQVRSLRRRGLPWRRGGSVVESLALDAGIHRNVAVLLSEALPGPATCGAVRPAIMLPLDARTWKKEDLDCVVVHELEHVRRGDWASRCLARAVCAVYWFHPLVWAAWRRLALEAERSCDDAVLRRAEATAYADQLVGFARRLAAPPPSPLPAMANPTDLATRVKAVLDSRQRRGRVGTLSVALAAAAVLVTTMSPLRIVAAAQSSPAQAGAPHFNAASVKINLAAPSPRKYDETVSPTRHHFQDLALQYLLEGAAVSRSAGPTLSAASVRWICSQAGRGGDCPTGFAGGPRLDPIRFDCTFCTVSAAIARAYGVSFQQLRGGPDWINKDRYRVQVVSASPTDAAGMMRLLQQVLAQSFHLQAHLVSNPVPAYALVVAKSGIRFHRLGGDASDAPGPRFGFAGANAHFSTLAQLVTYLNSLYYGHAGGLDRPVVDHSGLAGRYDITLDLARLVGGEPVLSLVKEQLGLDVQATQGTARLLDIDGLTYLRGSWNNGDDAGADR